LVISAMRRSRIVLEAVATASSTIRDLRIAEITKLDIRLEEGGKVVQFRARVSLSFKYEA